MRDTRAFPSSGFVNASQSSPIQRRNPSTSPTGNHVPQPPTVLRSEGLLHPQIGHRAPPLPMPSCLHPSSIITLLPCPPPLRQPFEHRLRPVDRDVKMVCPEAPQGIQRPVGAIGEVGRRQQVVEPLEVVRLDAPDLGLAPVTANALDSDALHNGEAEALRWAAVRVVDIALGDGRLRVPRIPPQGDRDAEPHRHRAGKGELDHVYGIAGHVCLSYVVGDWS